MHLVRGLAKHRACRKPLQEGRPTLIATHHELQEGARLRLGADGRRLGSHEYICHLTAHEVVLAASLSRLGARTEHASKHALSHEAVCEQEILAYPLTCLGAHSELVPEQSHVRLAAAFRLARQA